VLIFIVALAACVVDPPNLLKKVVHERVRDDSVGQPVEQRWLGSEVAKAELGRRLLQERQELTQYLFDSKRRCLRRGTSLPTKMVVSLPG